MNDYATAMKQATTREEKAGVANAFLTEFLDARTDEGESIAEVVFALHPDLAQQVSDLIDTDTRRTVTVRFDFDKTPDDLRFTGMRLVEDQTSLSVEDRKTIGEQWAQSVDYKILISGYLPELIADGGTLTSDQME
ncbi:hypothetical protein [Aeromicrobium sp. 179-A 4D2 NHS]|uniref:hypothetical protein n=1 Tax=Aeromicrobium sp. 179-A 4D2 NHS TaxID=3142375 RepID=UPI00399F3AEE